MPVDSPFPAGSGPWCQKGHVYRGVLLNLDAYVPGGAAAALERLESPELRLFFAQPFFATGWYDIFPMIALIVQVARLRGVPYFTAVSELSRRMVDGDMNGLYRALLRVVTPGLVAPRLPRIQAQYLNFGSLEILETGAKQCVVRRTDHPKLLLHWYMAVVHGFLPCVLQAAGASDVRVHWDPPEVTRVDEGGFERVGMTIRTHWT